MTDRSKSAIHASDGYALITGAAGGIGRAMALELAARGFGLILTDCSEAPLQKLAGELEACFPADRRTGTAGRYVPIVQDLTEPGGAAGLCGRIEEYCGFGETADAGSGRRVSVLINIAGVYANIEDELADPGTAAKLLALHVSALTELCLYFGGRMAETGGGCILNLSSISSLFHDPSSVTYGASKNYIRFFSRSLDLELRPRGVTVSCLMPGGVDTSFFDRNNVFIPAFVRRTLLPPARLSKIALDRMFRGRRLIVPGLSGKAQALLFRIIVRPVFYGTVKRAYGRLKRAKKHP